MAARGTAHVQIYCGMADFDMHSLEPTLPSVSCGKVNLLSASVGSKLVVPGGPCLIPS